METASKLPPKPRIYIDTSVIGYLVNRPSSNLLTLNRQLQTRGWWDLARTACELFVSQAVINECERGNPEAAARRLEACAFALVLPITPDALALSVRLMDAGVVPQTEADDALHIALASLNQMDALMTWNFKHMAGEQARQNVRDALIGMGFKAPMFTTPAIYLEEIL